MSSRTMTSFLNLLTCLVLVVTTTVPPVTDTGQDAVTVQTAEMPSGEASSSSSSSASSSSPISLISHRDGPRVDMRHSGNVSSVLGRTASLRCRVLDKGNKTVSWIRHRDLHLLTVDKYTYTSDQRFQAMFEPSTGDWVLLVASVQLRDRGVYECQIGTTPPRSHFVALHIIEPRTEILGGDDLHINTGSTINLTCLVLYHARSPHAITWHHEGKEIHYDSSRGGVSILTEAGEVTRSALLIQRATRKDSGNYTCQPRGAEPATARVHVLHGEHRAAMQGGVGGGGYPASTHLVSWAAWAALWWAELPLYHPVGGSLATWAALWWAELPLYYPVGGSLAAWAAVWWAALSLFHLGVPRAPNTPLLHLAPLPT